MSGGDLGDTGDGDGAAEPQEVPCEEGTICEDCQDGCDTVPADA